MSLRSLLPLLFPVSVALASQPELPLVDAQECRPRLGLPNFLAKAKTDGAEIKVAYFGGSITAQQGWRPKSLAHFQKTWPQAKFSEINAAIGGTGSELGVCRLKQDVLDRQPDLLFVEFAVNDAGTSPEQIFRCMEGIVRQTWAALPDCDICFVYTLTESLALALIDGKFQRSASAMEKIADHYGIPSIHLGMEVAKLAREQRLEWKRPLPKTDEEKAALGNKVVFAPDSVHPHPETGHELYLQAIVRSLDPMIAASSKPGAHALPEPFIPTHYQAGKLIPISAANASPGIVALDAETDNFAKRWHARIPNLYKGSKPGETLTFRFRGTYAAIYDVIGPDCGQVIITVDNQPSRIMPRFDGYCSYHRLSTLLIARDLPDEVHTVKIEIHPEQPDKEKILAQRNASMDMPERFEGTAFYPGAILLVGELVK
jgi:GDSL-like Lipase/Acylhydrolase family